MTPVKGRLFYIPTNRPCGESLSLYLEEVAHLASSQSAPVVFSLIESNDAPHVEDHGRTIAKAVGAYGISAIHLTLDRQRGFIEAVLETADLSAQESADVRTLLMPSGVAYGAGPNKAALLAASLGAETLHRRDSDTVPLIHDGAPLYPSELEARYAGLSFDQFRGEISTAFPVDEDPPLLFVGSDYAGDPAVDRMELAELSFELAVEHERLRHPAASRESLEQRVQRNYLERNPGLYERDQVEVDTIGATELGVSCCHRVFLYLPEMPLRATLGCDYFQKNLLYRLGWPVLYHNRRVGHRYSPDRDTRSSDDTFVAYNLMDARYKVLWRVWSRHNRQLEQQRAELLSSSDETLIDTSVYADSFDVACQITPRAELIGIVDELGVIYRRAFKLAPGKFRYARLADILVATREQLVDEVVNGIADYTKLIRLWRRLIEASRKTQVLSDGTVAH
jgi:hypothetical protein